MSWLILLFPPTIIKASTIAVRAQYLREQLAKPPSERLLHQPGG